MFKSKISQKARSVLNCHPLHCYNVNMTHHRRKCLQNTKTRTTRISLLILSNGAIVIKSKHRNRQKIYHEFILSIDALYMTYSCQKINLLTRNMASFAVHASSHQPLLDISFRPSTFDFMQFLTRSCTIKMRSPMTLGKRLEILSSCCRVLIRLFAYEKNAK